MGHTERRKKKKTEKVDPVTTNYTNKFIQSSETTTETYFKSFLGYACETKDISAEQGIEILDS